MFTSMVQQLNDHGIHEKLSVKSFTKWGEGESFSTNVKGRYRTTTTKEEVSLKVKENYWEMSRMWTYKAVRN